MTEDEKRIYDLSMHPTDIEILRWRVERSGSAPGSLEPEPVDAEGLNASERAACTATGCTVENFLKLKKAVR
jgi:hypothetical protein